MDCGSGYFGGFYLTHVRESTSARGTGLEGSGRFSNGIIVNSATV